MSAFQLCDEAGLAGCAYHVARATRRRELPMTDPVTTAAPLGHWPETTRPMGIGVMLPLLDGGAFGGQPRFKDILEMAQTVEACGFDAVWMPDHFIFRHEANNRTPQGIW